MSSDKSNIMEASEILQAEMENSEKNRNQPKFPKMQILQLTRKKFATAGITKSLTTQAHPFNGGILIGFLTVNAALISSVLYLIYGAESFAEYTQSVYCASFAGLVIGNFTIIIFKANTLFEYIENCESLVNTSEYRNQMNT